MAEFMGEYERDRSDGEPVGEHLAVRTEPTRRERDYVAGDTRQPLEDVGGSPASGLDGIHRGDCRVREPRVGRRACDNSRHLGHRAEDAGVDGHACTASPVRRGRSERE